MHYIKIIFLFFQYFHLIISYIGSLHLYSECSTINYVNIDGREENNINSNPITIEKISFSSVLK